MPFRSAHLYRIMDVITAEIRYGASRAGFVLIPERFRPSGAIDRLIGETIVIISRSSDTWVGCIADARDHGVTASMLIEGWPDGADHPEIGWMILIPESEV